MIIHGSLVVLVLSYHHLCPGSTIMNHSHILVISSVILLVGVLLHLFGHFLPLHMTLSGVSLSRGLSGYFPIVEKFFGHRYSNIPLAQTHIHSCFIHTLHLVSFKSLITYNLAHFDLVLVIIINQ